jgi:hypothetical protein
VRTDADSFWTEEMAPKASAASYLFASSPTGWHVPHGYPWLDVEIGGGMAAAYNHRVHMCAAPSDPRRQTLAASPSLFALAVCPCR